MRQIERRIERRIAVEALSLREASDGVTLNGYASTFGQPYDMGWYTESVDANAFRETLGRKPDVRLLVNHAGLPLARTTSGTLMLDTDSRGLRVEASLDPADPDVASLVPKMRRGDLSQMSFGFRVAKNGDDWSDDMRIRTLRNLDLNDGDVSVVTYPANPGTSAGLRAEGGSNLEAVASALLALETRGATGEQIADLMVRAQRAVSTPVVSADALAKGTDAVLDEAMNVLGDYDTSGLPAEVAQALDLMRAAWASAGAALDAADLDDPDDRSRAGDTETRAAVSDAAWDGSASRFTIEQWRASCLVDMGGDSTTKANYKLPVREPDGTLNRAACHNAAARISQLDAPASVIAAAKKKLTSLYTNQLHEDVPDSLRKSPEQIALEARRLQFSAI